MTQEEIREKILQLLKDIRIDIFSDDYDLLIKHTAKLNMLLDDYQPAQFPEVIPHER